jgi:predicted aconitase/predicted aconitase with swiveling domain
MKFKTRLNNDHEAMLSGKMGGAKQMAMRLLLDLAATAGAGDFVEIQSAHLSGVSPLTGGLGLRQFLSKLTSDPSAQVAVPTTLNAAGCDARQFELMQIVVPDFLKQSQDIVEMYTRLGVQPTQSCIPYEWEGVIVSGHAAWSESNAICFGNSYCDLMTNRESGLSALASALTGYTPRYGLLEENSRRPNLEVTVTCTLEDPTDFSILGDWIGRQRQPSWQMPYGPIPLIKGLPADLSHEQRKALTAAAANYGTALLFIEGIGEQPEPVALQDSLVFNNTDLQERYAVLRPTWPVSLVTIGCPQASIGELRQAAKYLKGRKVSAEPDHPANLPPIWIFTSSANKAIAKATGLADIIRQSGAALLENTCPEVVPYDQQWVKHILTNSMKAEHYLKSGLNGIPTSVMTLEDCIAVATGKLDPNEGRPGIENSLFEPPDSRGRIFPEHRHSKAIQESSNINSHNSFEALGLGLPSQKDFTIKGKAFVTDTPITFLGFVNRQTGVIEEPGHPADGRSMADKIAIFPKGTGSTVAPYVLLELYYVGVAPIAIINTEIDQQTAPACSLESIPYAYNFDKDIISGIEDGDDIELVRQGDQVTVKVLYT